MTTKFDLESDNQFEISDNKEKKLDAVLDNKLDQQQESRHLDEQY